MSHIISSRLRRYLLANMSGQLWKSVNGSGQRLLKMVCIAAAILAATINYHHLFG